MVNVFDVEKNQTEPKTQNPNFVLLFVILVIFQIGILSVIFSIRNHEENPQRVSKYIFYFCKYSTSFQLYQSLISGFWTDNQSNHLQ